MDQRASDGERERTAERLRQAAGEGRLTVDELDDRLQAAFSATTRGELERLTDDVAVAPPAGHRQLPVVPGDGEARIISIFGGAQRKGRWTVGRQCRVINIMGGSELDLNDAELSAQVVEMQITSIMGGAEVYVPEGLNVEVSQTAIMGGNEIDLGDSRPGAGAPVLRLKLFSLFGGCEVKRGRKLSRRERRKIRSDTAGP